MSALKVTLAVCGPCGAGPLRCAARAVRDTGIRPTEPVQTDARWLQRLKAVRPLHFVPSFSFSDHESIRRHYV